MTRVKGWDLSIAQSQIYGMPTVTGMMMLMARRCLKRYFADFHTWSWTECAAKPVYSVWEWWCDFRRGRWRWWRRWRGFWRWRGRHWSRTVLSTEVWSRGTAVYSCFTKSDQTWAIENLLYAVVIIAHSLIIHLTRHRLISSARVCSVAL